MPAPSLDRYREKWREAPRGSDVDGRVFSTDLLKLSDEELMAAWSAMAERRYGGELAWLEPLYGDLFQRSKILDLGAGLGFDGIRFAERGARWTFADIVPDNLAVIERIATLRGLRDRVRFFLIGDDLSFDALPRDFDVVWVFGSIHHVPFEVARQEALAVLPHLKPGGRWMELVYPRERWLREGAMPFDRWGTSTDGERTPWAEWQNAEKVRSRLFPGRFRTVLEFDFSSATYRWIDLLYEGMVLCEQHKPADLLTEPLLLPGARRIWGKERAYIAPANLWAGAASIDLGSIDGRLPQGRMAVDLDLEVTRGSIGVGLLDGAGSYLSGAEAVVNASPDRHFVTLGVLGAGVPARLLFRNLRAGVRSRFSIGSVSLRAAA
jgi:SAM-dependent methyltransferase